MTSTQTLTQLKRQLKPILKSYGITRAGLFGSAARGEMKRGSDVDLLIDTKGKLGLFQFVGLKRELEQSLDRPVDLVEYQAIKSSIRKRVLDEHISII